MTAMIEALIAETRAQLPYLSQSVCLNHAGVSPQPLVPGVAEYERQRADMLPHEMFARQAPVRDKVKRLYARLLGVMPEEIAVTGNTAEGVNIVAQGFPWRRGDRIVLVDVEYPSNVYPWWNVRDQGVEVYTISEREGRVDMEELNAALTDRTRLVAVSHVQFSSGFAVDLRRLADLCRPRGIFLFVDIAQSIGARPVDLSLVDAAAWSAWKWLMGPLGVGGFYLAQRHLDLIKPRFVGVDGMQPTADYLEYRFALRDSAARFEYSTPNLAGLISTLAALERVTALLAPGAVVRDGIPERILANADRLIAALEPRGYRLFSSRAPGERSGILSFVTPEPPAQIVGRLKSRGVEAAARAGRLRLSPHFYNTAEDIDRCVQALAA